MDDFEYKGFKIKPGNLISFDIKEEGRFCIGKKQCFDIEEKDKNFTVCLLTPDMELIKKEGEVEPRISDDVEILERYRLKALENGIKVAIDKLLEEEKLKEDKYFWYFEYIDTGQWLRID